MREPKIEKLNPLRNTIYQLKESQKDINAQTYIVNDEIARIEASLLHPSRNMDVSLRNELIKAKEKLAELRDRYSQVSENVKAGIELQCACEAWLEEQKIPVPDDTTRRSLSYYPR